MNKKIRLFLKLLVTLGFLLLLVHFINCRAALDFIVKADRRWVFFALLTAFVPFMIATFRWKILLKAQGYVFSYKELLLVVVSGQFFNLFLPNLIAADIYRGVVLSQQKTEKEKIVSSIIVDRVTGFIGLGIVTVISYMIGGRIAALSNVIYPMAFFWVVTVGLLVAMFNDRFVRVYSNSKKNDWRWIRWLQDIHRNVHMFKNRPKALFDSIAVSVFMQGLAPVWCMMLFKAVGVDISFIPVFIIVPIVLTIGSLPFAFSGLGARDAAMVYFFYQLGIAKEQVLAVSFLLAFLYVIIEVIGGLLYVAFYHRRLQSYKNASGV